MHPSNGIEDCIRCHKCRHQILEHYSESLVNAHGQKLQSGDDSFDCESLKDVELIYLAEDNIPTWIHNKIEEESWMKGKLHCCKCGGKVGSFDFVTGRKCSCGNFVLPGIHLIHSQVDITTSMKPLSAKENG